MDIYYMEFLNCLENLHEKDKQLIASLPQQALDWLSQPCIGSLCMIVSHVAGAERYWVGEVIGREQPIRRAGTVYRVTGLDSRELCKRLDDSLSCCRKVLEKCEKWDLDDKRISPRDGQEVTVRWSLLHTIEHTFNHQWDINFLYQSWEKRQVSRTYQKSDRETMGVWLAG